jgi:hypothetical protein
LTATRVSQGPIGASASGGGLASARTKVSCTTSSASLAVPVIRYAIA